VFSVLSVVNPFVVVVVVVSLSVLCGLRGKKEVLECGR
jgi:hypothetical protein